MDSLFLFVLILKDSFAGYRILDWPSFFWDSESVVSPPVVPRASDGNWLLALLRTRICPLSACGPQSLWWNLAASIVEHPLLSTHCWAPIVEHPLLRTHCWAPIVEDPYCMGWIAPSCASRILNLASVSLILMRLSLSLPYLEFLKLMDVWIYSFVKFGEFGSLFA